MAFVRDRRVVDVDCETVEAASVVASRRFSLHDILRHAPLYHATTCKKRRKVASCAKTTGAGHG